MFSFPAPSNMTLSSFFFLQWRSISVFLACTIPLELPFINQVKERRVLSLSFRLHCKDMQVLSAPFMLVIERFYRQNRRTYSSFSGVSQRRMCSNHCLTAQNQQSWKTPFPVVGIVRSHISAVSVKHRCVVSSLT